MKSQLIKYMSIQEKFDLPQLRDLTRTFEFEIDDNEDILDQIRSEVSEKIFSFTEKIIEPIIMGSDSFSSVFEQNMISQPERKKLFDLYKEIQALKWENNMLIMKKEEKKTIEWIKKTWDFWNNELEEELFELCRKLSTDWKELKFANEKTNYHG